MLRLLRADSERAQQYALSRRSYPTTLVDQKIEEKTEILRKSRLFHGFDRVRYSLTMLKELVDGQLSGGTAEIRGRSIAWCVRALAYSDELDRAEMCLNHAKLLGNCQEIEIADAVIWSWKDNRDAALSGLATIDSPVSRSAALMVVAHHDGPQKAVEWLKTAGLDASKLDADGKLFLLHCLHNVADWEAAEECLQLVTKNELKAAPALHYMVAMIRLLSTVPSELRTLVLRHPPILAAGFPLADDTNAIEIRRVAHRHFMNAEQAARRIGCSYAATIADEYALWLELRDPRNSAEGRKRLESKLRNLKSGLRYVYLGLEFKVSLDFDAIHREIEQQIALNGGSTPDTSLARLALAFKQETPEYFTNYIVRHYDELIDHVDKKAIQIFQIDMFLQAGRPERAAECLDALVKEGLSHEEEQQLRARIVQAEATDPIKARIKEFSKTNSLPDLIQLVDELDNFKEWELLCKYAELLFKRTQSLPDAMRLAKALSNAQRNEILMEFLKANRTLLEQSEYLKILFCWSLYHEGELLEARSEISHVASDWDDPNYRTLKFNLAIGVGDWNSLSAILANECSQRDNRDPEELITAAHLAVNVDLLSARDLIFAAACKGYEDAHVLADAYFLATRAGWDDDPECYQWLERAAMLSGENGPIQKVSLKDLVGRQPEWDRRESSTREQLSRGKIPMSLAADCMNRSLFNEMLIPALNNLTLIDPRQRYAIPAYSGERPSVPIDTRLTVGFDVTTLITLGFLNLLDEVLDVFDTIVMPHSTLPWLFEEKRMARFHQPSRIEDALQVRELLATGHLTELKPSVLPDNELSSQVGEDLALLIAEATQHREDEDAQRVVVRTYPVHRLASLMEEEVDLTAYATVLSSCQSIVDRLRQLGRITAGEEKKARNYLRFHERPWPNQPEIADKAILYLDNVAVTYFLHLGLLGKLKAAEYRPIVSTRTVSEANAYISYDRVSLKVDSIIERIRSAVSLRIESGKIKIGRLSDTEQTTESTICERLTLELISLTRSCDAIISDDRFFNQHSNVDGGGSQASTLSTLDLLDALVSTGSIAPDDRLEYRTRLRRAGYFFIPVGVDELKHHLCASRVQDGRVIEKAELKAIRENVLHVRMSEYLQLPNEALWLDSLLEVFIRVLRDLWMGDADLAITRARSNWIVDQIVVRGWASKFGRDDGNNLVKSGRGKYIIMILMPPADAPDKVKKEYWNWAEDRVLVPIKEQYPKLYSHIVKWVRRLIDDMADMDITESSAQ